MLSYTDGAQVACGFGTVYEGLEKIGMSGNDAVLVVGLGPVGLAALVLAKALGASKLIGVDFVEDRLEVAQNLGLADHVVKAGPGNVEEIRGLTGGYGVERAFDASGSDKRRLTAIQATRKWSASLASFKIQLSFLPMSAQGRLAAQPVLLLQSSPRSLLELVTRGTDARQLHETWPGHAHFP